MRNRGISSNLSILFQLMNFAATWSMTIHHAVPGVLFGPCRFPAELRHCTIFCFTVGPLLSARAISCFDCFQLRVFWRACHLWQVSHAALVGAEQSFPAVRSSHFHR